MKSIILILTLVLLAGCGSVKVSQSPDGTFEFSSRTLWKDVESAEFQSNDFIGSLGRSSSVEDVKALTAVCILYPDLPGCQK